MLQRVRQQVKNQHEDIMECQQTQENSTPNNLWQAYYWSHESVEVMNTEIDIVIQSWTGIKTRNWREHHKYER